MNGTLNVPIAVRASAYWWITRLLNKTTSKTVRFAVVPSTFALKSSRTATPMCASKVKMNKRPLRQVLQRNSQIAAAGEAGIRAQTIPCVKAMTSPSPIASHGSSVKGTLATSASS